MTREEVTASLHHALDLVYVKPADAVTFTERLGVAMGNFAMMKMEEASSSVIYEKDLKVWTCQVCEMSMSTKEEFANHLCVPSR